jgi:FixJ family two-component response regulator
MSNHEIKVAIIDDDDTVRDSLTELLDSVGYQSAAFANAAEFLNDFYPAHIGCILLDVRMPGMSGIELQHKLKDMNVFTPIIIMTGHGDITMAVQAMKDGAFEFMQKPFRDQAILDTISRALEKNLIDKNERDRHREIQVRINSLTDRERQVVNHVLEGKANKVIARELEVSDRTIEVHRSHAMKKLNVNSVAELVKAMVYGNSRH